MSRELPNLTAFDKLYTRFKILNNSLTYAVYGDEKKGFEVRTMPGGTMGFKDTKEEAENLAKELRESVLYILEDEMDAVVKEFKRTLQISE